MDQQRTIEFILDQQAKFFAGLEELRQQMTNLRQQVSEFAGQQGQINMSLGKAMLGLTEHVETLVAAQAHTDRRLDALIRVVDGIVHRPPAPE
jgi:hypothetical protein